MKLITYDEDPQKGASVLLIAVSGPLAGQSCHEIALSAADFQALLRMPETYMCEYIRYLATKLKP